MILKYIYVNNNKIYNHYYIMLGKSTNNVRDRNFVLSFFLIEGFHLWFSFIACPQHLQMIDNEAHCCLLCQIFLETHMGQQLQDGKNLLYSLFYFLKGISGVGLEIKV